MQFLLAVGSPLNKNMLYSPHSYSEIYILKINIKWSKFYLSYYFYTQFGIIIIVELISIVNLLFFWFYLI